MRAEVPDAERASANDRNHALTPLSDLGVRPNAHVFRVRRYTLFLLGFLMNGASVRFVRPGLLEGVIHDGFL